MQGNPAQDKRFPRPGCNADLRFVTQTSGLPYRRAVLCEALPSNKIPELSHPRRTTLRLTLALRFPCPVIQHFHGFQREQPAAHHAIQHGQERLNLLLAIYDLYHER
jgi:hypothetical protein